jgi:hypothetical protein
MYACRSTVCSPWECKRSHVDKHGPAGECHVRTFLLERGLRRRCSGYCEAESELETNAELYLKPTATNRFSVIKCSAVMALTKGFTNISVPTRCRSWPRIATARHSGDEQSAILLLGHSVHAYFRKLRVKKVVPILIQVQRFRLGLNTLSCQQHNELL